MVGLQFDDNFPSRDRLAWPSLFFESDAEVITGFGIGGIERNRTAELSDRLINPAHRKQRHCQKTPRLGVVAFKG